jgi:hypothetical protein
VGWTEKQHRRSVSVLRPETGVRNSLLTANRRWPWWYPYECATCGGEADENQKMELTVHELRLMGGVCRAVVVVSTVLGIAMLNAGPRAPTARSS